MIRELSHTADTEAAAAQPDGHPAEELHRSLPIVEQELHRQEVQDHPGKAGDPVLRGPQLTGPMVDRDLDDLGARDEGEGGDETVHLPEQLQMLDHLAVVGLQRAPEVVQMKPGDPRDEGVGRHRRKPPHDQLVLAVGPPPRRHVVALVEGDQKRRDVSRIVLLVAVHDHDHPTRCVLEPCADPGGLAEVPPELDHLDALVPLVPRERLGPGGVGAPVVDQDQLDVEGKLPQLVENLGHGEVDALLLVVEGNDHAEVDVGPGIRRFGLGSGQCHGHLLSWGKGAGRPASMDRGIEGGGTGPAGIGHRTWRPTGTQTSGPGASCLPPLTAVCVPICESDFPRLVICPWYSEKRSIAFRQYGSACRALTLL